VASVSETGWPYVQYRGGPPGFLRVLSDAEIGWADFRGKLQYVSVGNLRGDDRVAMIVMDHPTRRRPKIYGHARVKDAADDPGLVEALQVPGYDAVVERVVVVTVSAFAGTATSTSLRGSPSRSSAHTSTGGWPPRRRRRPNYAGSWRLRRDRREVRRARTPVRPRVSGCWMAPPRCRCCCPSRPGGGRRTTSDQVRR
jgi:predicted pyridoxine 5'-phosphate oxidase superfamily flavin-nucleotide-binding protein